MWRVGFSGSSAGSGSELGKLVDGGDRFGPGHRPGQLEAPVRCGRQHSGFHGEGRSYVLDL